MFQNQPPPYMIESLLKAGECYEMALADMHQSLQRPHLDDVEASLRRANVAYRELQQAQDVACCLRGIEAENEPGDLVRAQFAFHKDFRSAGE